MKIFFISFYLVLSILFLIQCEQEPTGPEPSPEPNVWIEHSSLNLSDKILYNSNIVNGKLVLIGYSTIFVFDSSGPKINNYFGTIDLYSKPVITNNILSFGYDRNRCLCFTELDYFTENLGGDWIYSKSIYIPNIDSLLNINGSYWSIHSTRRSPVCAINSQNQFVFPVGFYTNENGNYIYMGKLTREHNYTTGEGYRLSDEKLIKFPGDYAIVLTHVYEINTYYDKFFIGAGMGKNSFLLRQDGTFITQDFCCYDFFQYRDTLYGLSYDILYRSTDQGESWHPYLSGVSNYVDRFFVIQDKLCWYVNDKIVRLDLETLEYYELVNEGLEGNTITSVIEYNGKVYVTTLSGLFYKDVDKFFVRKSTEKSNKLLKLAN
ncbi:MAG: hypothetical protein JXA68_01720 [Ignavibacteriales bacterium]|nr:hypothetical protein [Ignavibacteriales bacterium]